MNKSIKKYFDYLFENTELDTRPYEDDGSEWTGVWKDNVLICGYPSDDDDGTWFSSGPYFSSGISMFGMEPHEFFGELRKYMSERYDEYIFRKIY